MGDLEKSVWVYKQVEEDAFDHLNIELILNLYSSTKFELNLNYFNTSFSIDLETYFNHDQQTHVNLDDDNVFKSKYHHSLLQGTYQIKDKTDLVLSIDRAFTNEKDIFTEDNKEFTLFIEDNALILDGDSPITRLLQLSSPITLTPIRSPQKKTITLCS